ncbi:MAG: hypothetical protein IJO43_02985 [Bacilli bacterium]|nr:hypothetical protein [Bacilli bacterium]
MGNSDKFIEEINLQLEELDKYLIECDNKVILIPLEEIVATGLFESIDEIEVFFFSFDGEYYGTDIAFIKYMKDLYTGMLDEMDINRLFWS